jgi:hypothetical protein
MINHKLKIYYNYNILYIIIMTDLYFLDNNNDLEILISKFIFIPELDQFGNDIYNIPNKSIIELMNIAIKDDACICFNTFGFFKNKIDKLSRSQIFTTEYGIYIKKEYYYQYVDKLEPIYKFPKIDTNSSNMHAGRFGNKFFVNIALSFIAEKNNLLCSYDDVNNFEKLGINLFSGNYIYKENIILTDDNFFKFIINDKINKNVIIRNTLWCQTKEFALFLKKYFDETEQKSKIMGSNLYKNNYNVNNDVFIHVRLGDIKNDYGQFNHPYEYYDKVLKIIEFVNGYISSDSIEDILCQKLIEKYNLKIINYDIIETIMFASTCKNIILSHGTFSWMIGIFGYYSDVYYPKVIKKWHGDIFVFPEWKEINISQ